MIILTAFAIGLLSVGLRSLVCYVVAALLIMAVFCLAMLTSAGSVPWIFLAEAMFGYNAGIASTVAAAYAVTSRRQA